MASPDPEHVNFLLEHLGKFIGALAGALLLAMQYISKSRKAEVARKVLIDEPVSHTEFLEYQLSLNKTLVEQFEEVRREFLEEVRRLHSRIDTL